jgi:peptidylprolyl isomerase
VRSFRILGLVALASSVLAAPQFAGAATTVPKGDHPIAGVDHWHMAYGISICGKWQPPLPSGEDPTGVHTHGDGLVHIHPFGAAAAGKSATMKRFFEAEKVSVTEKSVALAGGKKYSTGDKCGSTEGVVRTLLWANAKSSKAIEVPGDPGTMKLVDGAVIAFVFGPKDAKIGKPPSIDELLDPADVAPPALNAIAIANLPKPPATVPVPVMKGTPPSKLTITDLTPGSSDPVKTGQRVYARYSIYLWRTGEQLTTSSWDAKDQPEGFPRLGKKRLLPGMEAGLLGMKVGGVRQVVIPPADGFGAKGNGPILGTDTLVLVVQLAAIAK